MKTIGIIAEYNPFHAGHAWHIAQTKQMFQEETAVIAAMSGNWVQRGECAITDKWTRTQMALNGGSDLVLELPTVWATTSAESFAQGAIATLSATGVVDVLSFGSECGEVAPLQELAHCINSSAFSHALRQELEPKKSFAQSRRMAVARILGLEKATLLDHPNNNLGVEYLRFLPPNIEAVTISRRGANHDSKIEQDGFLSASLLRQRLRGGQLKNISTFQPSDMQWVERALISRLRTMTLEEAESFPDSGDGLAARLLSAARQTADLEELYTLTKTRTYTHSRVRRLALYALLGLRAADRPSAPLYLRVLGFNKLGQALLREMNQKATLPFFVKPAHIRRLSKEAQTAFALEERFTDLFSLCFPTPKPCGLEWTTTPVIQNISAV